jgi:hypothetical protein
MKANEEQPVDETNMQDFMLTREAIDQYMKLKENIGESLNVYQHSLKVREFEGLSQGAGQMKVKGLNQLAYKVYLSHEITILPKLLQFWTLLYAVVLAIVHLFKPTACINRAFAEGLDKGTLQERHLTIIYTSPCLLHLLSLAWIFTSFEYYKVHSIFITRS